MTEPKKKPGWKKLPKGWTPESAKKLWVSLGGEQGGVSEVAKRLKKSGRFRDPMGAAAGLADLVRGTTAWRGKARNPLPKGIKRKDVAHAVEVYRDFYGRDPEEPLEFAPYKSKPKALVKLGECLAVEYMAKKYEDRKKMGYRHEFENDELFYDPVNNALMIFGPDLTVTDRGIEN